LSRWRIKPVFGFSVKRWLNPNVINLCLHFSNIANLD